MKHITALLFVLLLYNCSSIDVDQFDFTADYYSNKILHDNIQVYSSNGRLNVNSEILFEHLAGRDEFSDLLQKFAVNNKVTMVPHSEKDFIALNSEYAIVNSTDSVLIERKGSLIRFQEIDTARYRIDFYSEILESMGKYSPKFSECCKVIATIDGFSYLKSTLPEIYGLTKGEKLVVPRVDFVFFGGGIFWSGAILNEFDPTMFNSLRSTDTLIVQQNWIIFEK